MFYFTEEHCWKEKPDIGTSKEELKMSKACFSNCRIVMRSQTNGTALKSCEVNETCDKSKSLDFKLVHCLAQSEYLLNQV